MSIFAIYVVEVASPACIHSAILPKQQETPTICSCANYAFHDSGVGLYINIFGEFFSVDVVGWWLGSRGRDLDVCEN